MNSTYQSIDDLLQWFSEAPRTKRWDALLAFDQATVNTLLLQQYIERFNSGSYLPPINKPPFPLGSGKSAEIRGYVFDKPRLSFENANLDVPTATLRMQGMGGVRFIWDVSGSVNKLESISYEYPVNGDVHESTVTLKDDSVSINGHRVIIDVADGVSPVLKFGGTLDEKKRAGANITSELIINPPEVREFVLSELKAGGDPLLAPKQIMLLTQPAPANRQRGTAQYGDGAVLAFVALGDGTPGDRPTSGDPQWRYLLDPSQGGHSAMIILSHAWVMGKFIPQRAINPESVEDERWSLEPDGTWMKLAGNYGMRLKTHWTTEPVDGWSATFDSNVGLNFPVAFTHTLSGCDVSWFGIGDVKAHYFRDGESVSFLPYPAVYGFGGDMKLSSRFEVETGTVTLEGVAIGDPDYRYWDWIESQGGTVIKPPRLTPINTELLFLSEFPQINATHLTSILLAGERPVQLNGANWPGDLVMYGNISNERTGLELNQQEVMIGASTSFQFTATGAGTGAVTWALEWVDGTPAKPNDAGAITADGRYTAPAVTSSYARVRLTARRGDFVTLALITVVRELAAVSPAIQLAVAGSGTRYFVRGGATGDWAWDTSGLKGKLQEPVPEPGDEFEPGDMQYIPPATIDSNFIVEEIKIKVGTNVTTCKVVVTKDSTVNIAATLSDDFKTATLTASVSGTSIPGVTFVKVAGSGTLDGNQVTSEDVPAEPFIVVQCTYEPLPGISFMGYLLLPLPLNVLEGTHSRTILEDPSQRF